MPTPRMRVFGGPNGSGKSTLIEEIQSNNQFNFGYYINADIIEQAVFETEGFSLDIDLGFSKKDLTDFLTNSGWVSKIAIEDFNNALLIEENTIKLRPSVSPDYSAAIIADFLRHKLVEQCHTFTFESVLSDSRKLKFLKHVRECGYRIYLYFITTENPQINYQRVQERKKKGGHPVPSEKIHDRYHKAMALLSEYIKLSDRAYLFDNSSSEYKWIAECTEGTHIRLRAFRFVKRIKFIHCHNHYV